MGFPLLLRAAPANALAGQSPQIVSSLQRNKTVIATQRCRDKKSKMKGETPLLHNTATIVQEIARLKQERQAVILAHSYQLPEVQEVADFVGDSLGLAREAQKTSAQVIVFAGVHFMAETAAILNPEKTVLLPDLEAGCSLADSIRPQDVLRWKAACPEGLVVAYVNTAAEIKALADVCVTSANAVQVVASLPRDRPIFFVPDMFLGAHVAQVTGRELDLFPGECHVHVGIREEHLKAMVEEHPGAEFLIHPECSCGSSCLFLKPDAKLLSTEGMVRYAKTSESREFVVATEVAFSTGSRKKLQTKRSSLSRQKPSAST
jgi:quinolinate synthetase A